MTNSTKIWKTKGIALLALILSTSIFGQTSTPPVAVTISVDTPPFVLDDGEPSVLASITITENYPGALKNGFITLYGQDNVEQFFSFTESTKVSSPSSIEGFGRMPGHLPIMIIKVDVDDTVIDSITIKPVANVVIRSSSNDSYSYRNSELSFLLVDGHPAYHDGQEEIAAGEGVGLDLREFYTLGIYGGEGGIEIGRSETLELAVGETVKLLFNEGEPLHPRHNIVESLDSQVVSVGPYSPTVVELTGQNPGKTTVQAWDPIGNSGYLRVTVSEPAPEHEYESITVLELRPNLSRNSRSQSGFYPYK